MKKILLLIPFILMLVPTTAFGDHAYYHQTWSVDDLVLCYSEPYRKQDNCHYYYNIERSYNSKMENPNYQNGVPITEYYKWEDAYGRQVTITWLMPAWVIHPMHWYMEGKLHHTDIYFLFDWLVKNDIARPNT